VFQVKADVFGLSVSHELPDEFGSMMNTSKANQSITKSNMSDILPGSMYTKGGRD
jgi:hypothetical protein